ncbi:MAG: sensor histidine kinase [Candidatus Dormibacterales bacterium]
MAQAIGLVGPAPAVPAWAQGGVVERPTVEAEWQESLLAARLHLARELHDGLAQTLTGMLVELEVFRQEQFGRQSVLSEVDLLQASARDALNSVRVLLGDLRGYPPVQEDLAGSIREGLLRRFSERTGVRTVLSVSRAWPRLLPTQTALNLYRILQESLTNSGRHGGASVVKVRLIAAARTGVMEIRDDGRGLPDDHGPGDEGLGLVGMQERAVLIGGSLEVRGGRRGGVVVRASFPL